MKRKCVQGCIFAPYFDAERGAAPFAAVHKLFGASNVSKLLLQIPIDKRVDAIATLCYEAQARLRDPVYGCVAHIFALQQQVQFYVPFFPHLAAVLSGQPHPCTLFVREKTKRRKKPSLSSVTVLWSLVYPSATFQILLL